VNRCIMSAWIGWVAVAVAQASPYWVAYEGDDFPENVGWERRRDPQWFSTRRIEDGALVIDSSANERIYDYYAIERRVNPDPGEVFVAEWRVQTTIVSSPFGLNDVSVDLARDGGGIVAFYIFSDHISSDREHWSMPITPGEFHQFRLTSSDMLSYDLYVDGTFARTGVWDLESLNESFVAWGDTAQGAGVTTISEWDYFRFGVVPEPSARLMFFVTSSLVAMRRTGGIR